MVRSHDDPLQLEVDADGADDVAEEGDQASGAQAPLSLGVVRGQLLMLVFSLTLLFVRMVNLVGYHEVPVRRPPPSDCVPSPVTTVTTDPAGAFADENFDRTVRCFPQFDFVREPRPWRTLALIVVALIGVVLAVLGWLFAARVQAKGRPTPVPTSWEPTVADRVLYGMAIVFGIAYGGMALSLARQESSVAGGALDRAATLVIVVLLLAAVIGVVTGATVGFVTQGSLTPLECERGERRRAVRLRAAAFAVPFATFGSLFAVHFTGQQHLAFVSVVLLVACGEAAYLAWRTSRRVGLGRCQKRAPMH